MRLWFSIDTWATVTYKKLHLSWEIWESCITCEMRMRSLKCRKMRGSQHDCTSLIQGDHCTVTMVFLNQNFQSWWALTDISHRFRQAVSNMSELNTRVKAVWNQLLKIYRWSQELYQNHLRKYKASTIQQQHQCFSIKIDNTFTENFSVPVGSAKQVKLTDKCSLWRTYHKFMMLDQARPAIIAHSNFFLITIKKRKVKDQHQINDIILITFSYVDGYWLNIKLHFLILLS